MWRILPAIRPVGAVLTGSRGVVSDSPATVPVVTHALGAWAIGVAAWVVVIATALLVLRAVCLDPLDREQDQSDDEVSGNVPS